MAARRASTHHEIVVFRQIAADGAAKPEKKSPSPVSSIPGSADGSGRVHRDNLTDDQIIKKHPDGEMFEFVKGRPEFRFVELNPQDSMWAEWVDGQTLVIVNNAFTFAPPEMAASVGLPAARAERRSMETFASEEPAGFASSVYAWRLT